MIRPRPLASVPYAGLRHLNLRAEIEDRREWMKEHPEDLDVMLTETNLLFMAYMRPLQLPDEK